MALEDSQVMATIRRVMPAVVSVVISKDVREVAKELDALRAKARKKTRGKPFAIGEEHIDADGMVQVGGGSGFVVDPSGLILTNQHVIAEPHVRHTITTDSGETCDAEVLARDPVDDIAILKIKPTKRLPALTLGSSRDLELGQTVLAFGNALGIFKSTVSLGIISGLARAVRAHDRPDAPARELRGLIQTDAAINPGNSGGPLVDLYGRVVGINVAVVAGAQNIGFAIPIDAAKRDLEDLAEHGRIRRPLLGLRYLLVDENLKRKFGLTENYGALVTKEHPFDRAVIPGTPADKADIREGDLILTWNGGEITPEKSIQDYLERAEVGETVTLGILRKGERLEIPVTLTERK